MSENFDPFRVWLGIPKEEQPPHYYRLLGIGLYETDGDVIEQAADRQMAHVKTHSTGKYADVSQRVLGQLSSAKLCLLSAEKKAQYDQKLKSLMASKSRTKAPPAIPAASAPAAAEESAAEASAGEAAPMFKVDAAPSYASGARGRTPAKAGGGVQVWHMAAAGGGLLVLGLIAMFALGGNKADPPKPLAVNPVNSTPGHGDKSKDTKKPATTDSTFVQNTAKKLPETTSPSSEETPKKIVRRPPPSMPDETTPDKNPPDKSTPDVKTPDVTVPDIDLKVFDETNPTGKNPRNKKGDSTPPKQTEPGDEPLVIKRRVFGGRVDLSDLVARAEAEANAGSAQTPVKEVAQYVAKVEAMQPAEKDEVPSDQAYQKSVALVREVYKDQMTTAVTPVQKSTLAKQLFQEAIDTKGESDNRFAMLSEARDIALDAGSANMGMMMIDTMGKLYKIDSLEMKATTLTQVATKAKQPNVQRSIAANALVVVEQAVLENNYPLANQVLEVGLSQARNSRDKNLLEIASSLRTDLKKLEEQYQQFAVAKAKLQTTPEDPAANSLVGKYLCLVIGDWPAGLEHLSKGDDPALTETAKRDLADPKEAAEQAKAGDGWWDLAEAADELSKPQLQQRARHWYEQAERGLSGLTLAKLKSRLDKLASLDKGSSPLATPTTGDPKKEALPPFAQKFIGSYEIIATNQKNKTKTSSSLWQFNENLDAFESGQLVGKWEVFDTSRIKVNYTDEVQGFAVIKFNGIVVAGGLRTITENEAWRWELKRLTIVGVWEHSARRTEKLTFYSNGKINDPLGKSTWARQGNQIALTFESEPTKPVFVNLSPDGKSYEGRQNITFNDGFSSYYYVRGTLLSGPSDLK